jgi:hypothetical protein
VRGESNGELTRSATAVLEFQVGLTQCPGSRRRLWKELVFYMKVIWKHDLPDEPVLLYSEVDDDRWEKRKVEIFRAGPPGYADRTRSTGSTGLGLVQVPDLSEISADPEFEATEVSREEFERVWTMALEA